MLYKPSVVARSMPFAKSHKSLFFLFLVFFDFCCFVGLVSDNICFALMPKVIMTIYTLEQITRNQNLHTHTEYIQDHEGY